MFKNLNIKKILTYFWLLILFFIFFYFKDYIIDLLDYIVGDLLKQLLFPDVTTLLVIFIVINIMLVYIFKQKKLFIKIIDLLFYICISISFILMFYNVKVKELDVFNKILLYSDATILILVRIITISFLVLILLKLLKMIIKHLMQKGVIEEREYNTYINTISRTVTVRSNNYDKLGNTEILSINDIRNALADEKLAKTEIFSIDDFRNALNNEKLGNTEILSVDDIKDAIKKEYN